MEQILNNTAIIGTSITIQLEQWQLKRQWLEHQRQLSAAVDAALNNNDKTSPSLATVTTNFFVSPNNINNSTLQQQHQPIIYDEQFFNKFNSSNLFAGSGTADIYSTRHQQQQLLLALPAEPTHNHHHHHQNHDQASLETFLGSAREKDSVLISMTLIYSLILFSGIIGNSITLYVIWRHPRMHAGATNYYLASLAVSDLISLIFGLPLEMFQLFQSYPYPLPEVACVARGWLTEMATNSSVLCILLFTFERYLAVVHPLQVRLRSRVSRALPLVCIAWTVAFVAAAPIALQLGIVYQAYFDRKHRAFTAGSAVTRNSRSTTNSSNGANDAAGGEVPVERSQLCMIKYALAHSFQLSTVFLFVAPMLLIVIFHVIIVVKLQHASRSQGSLNRATSSDRLERASGGGGGSNDPTLCFNRGRRAVLRMLASVSLAFFVCYAPFHSQRLLASHLSDIIGNDSSTYQIYKIYLFISGILYYSASTVNPILYNILSVRFRRAFLEALCGCMFNFSSARGGASGAASGGDAASGASPSAHRRRYQLTGNNSMLFDENNNTDATTAGRSMTATGGSGGGTYGMKSMAVRTPSNNNKNALTIKSHNDINNTGPIKAGSSPSKVRSSLSVPKNNGGVAVVDHRRVVWRSGSFDSQSSLADEMSASLARSSVDAAAAAVNCSCLNSQISSRQAETGATVPPPNSTHRTRNGSSNAVVAAASNLMKKSPPERDGGRGRGDKKSSRNNTASSSASSLLVPQNSTRRDSNVSVDSLLIAKAMVMRQQDNSTSPTSTPPATTIHKRGQQQQQQQQQQQSSTAATAAAAPVIINFDSEKNVILDWKDIVVPRTEFSSSSPPSYAAATNSSNSNSNKFFRTKRLSANVSPKRNNNSEKKHHKNETRSSSKPWVKAIATRAARQRRRGLLLRKRSQERTSATTSTGAATQSSSSHITAEPHTCDDDDKINKFTATSFGSDAVFEFVDVDVGDSGGEYTTPATATIPVNSDKPQVFVNSRASVRSSAAATGNNSSFKRESTTNSIHRTLNVTKSHHGVLVVCTTAPINIVISPPSDRSRSDSLCSGSNSAANQL